MLAFSQPLVATRRCVRRRSTPMCFAKVMRLSADDTRIFGAVSARSHRSEDFVVPAVSFSPPPGKVALMENSHGLIVHAAAGTANFVFETMPPEAEDRAMQARTDWLVKSVESASNTFTKLVLTARDPDLQADTR
ncbi:MAG: hypothetical protein AB7G35_01135 [Hyphomicrobiaceae bacterium]